MHAALTAPTPEALTVRVRLMDAPAQPLLALARLVPARGGLAQVDVVPVSGGALARFASRIAAGELLMPDATAERLVSVPAAVISSLNRHHRHAARLAGDLLPSGVVVWRSLSEATALSLQAEEPAEPLPHLLVDRTFGEPLEEPYPLLFGASAIRMVTATLERVTAGPIRLRPLYDGGAVGCELSFEGGTDGLSGWIRVARMAYAGELGPDSPRAERRPVRGIPPPVGFAAPGLNTTSGSDSLGWRSGMHA